MPDPTAWYILQVYPGKERQIREKLEKRFHAQNRQYAVKVVNPSEALTGDDEAQKYAGLVFIQTQMEPELWTMIRNTPGVTGFVGMGSDPTPFQAGDWKEIPIDRFSSKGIM
jgi:transcriptional antiterminator NusG